MRWSGTTTLFMIGTTVGDAVLPVVVGFLLQYTGSKSLLYLMLIFSVIMASLYIAVHLLSVGLVSGDTTPKTAAESAQTELSHSVHQIRKKRVELAAEYELSQSLHASKLAGGEVVTGSAFDVMSASAHRRRPVAFDLSMSRHAGI